MRPMTSLLFSLAVLATTACGSSTGPNDDADNELVVRTSSSATGISILGELLNVDPASFRVRLAEMRVSQNVNCAGPYETVVTNSPPASVDFVAAPEIARVTTVPAGTYPCVALRLSDLIDFVPATTEGRCIAGTTFRKDFYRAGNEDVAFRDIAGTVIPATGTDGTPSEDIVWVFFSTNPSAVTARGYSPSQVNPLSTVLTVPGSTTLYWVGTNSVSDDGTQCEIEPGQIGFR